MPKVELLALLRRAEAGDEMALREARAVAEKCPKVWERLGNIPGTARDQLSGAIAANPLHREALERKVNEIRVAMAAPEPDCAGVGPGGAGGALLAAIVLRGYKTAGRMGEGVSLVRGVVQEKRAERAQKRYLAAIKTLAQVRKLQIPVI